MSVILCEYQCRFNVAGILVTMLNLHRKALGFKCVLSHIHVFNINMNEFFFYKCSFYHVSFNLFVRKWRTYVCERNAFFKKSVFAVAKPELNPQSFRTRFGAFLSSRSHGSVCLFSCRDDPIKSTMFIIGFSSSNYRPGKMSNHR